MAKDRRDHKRTGIDLIDNLTPQERKDLKARLQQHFDSLSHEGKTEHMNLVHDLVREKPRQHGGMISKQDAIKEYLNEVFPAIIEEGANDIQEEALRTGNIGYAHIAESLRETKWGTKVFDIQINLVDDDRDVGVGPPYNNEERAKEE